MAEPTVEESVRDGVVVLKISYESDWLTEDTPAEEHWGRLAEVLIKAYEQPRKANPALLSCVVEIEASTVGSPLAKALQKLYGRVHGVKGARLVCVGWQPAYGLILDAFIPSESERFSQADSLDEAVKMVKTAKT